VKPKLRAYQAAAIDAIEGGFRSHPSVCVSMATGTGKTWVFGSLVVRAARNGWRCLILAHRDELLEQAIGCLLTLDPRARVGKVKGDRREWEQITVASVASLGARRLPGMPRFDLIVTDEAHHADAPSYQAIYARARQLNPDVLHLGVTATPFRADRNRRGKATGIDEFDAQVFSYGLHQAVQDRWLAEIRALAPIEGFNLEGVQRDRVTGDFSPKALEARLNRPEVHATVYRQWRAESRRQTIAFCATTRHARDLAEYFRSQGQTAAAVWSGMNKPSEQGKGAREDVIRRYKAGSLRVITNVAILTEGFDAPATRCIIMLRPTASLVRYSQMIGRGTRPAPGKMEGLILDYTGNTTALDLQAARLSDLAERYDADERPPIVRGSEMYCVYRIARAGAPPAGIRREAP